MRFTHDAAMLVVGCAKPLAGLDPPPTVERLMRFFGYLDGSRSRGGPELFGFLPGEVELTAEVELASATHLVVGAVVATSRFEPSPFTLDELESAKAKLERVPVELWATLAHELSLTPTAFPGEIETLAFVSTGDTGGNRGGVVYGVRRPTGEAPTHALFARADVYDAPPPTQIDGVAARTRHDSAALFEYEEIVWLDASPSATDRLRAEVADPSAGFFLFSEYG